MAILITVETLILALLALLVAGLLRSHAEILRRLAELEGERPRTRPVGQELAPARDAGAPAFDVAGNTLSGDAVKLAVSGGRANTLLAFLSSGCLPCVGLWKGLSQVRPPSGSRLVVVTKDRSEESPTKLRDLAPPGTTLVMSSQAWLDYGVKGSPYFVYVDGLAGQVHSEGSATNWDQVTSLLRDALADQDLARHQQIEGEAFGDGSAERIRRADHELAAAGILPGHPSLWQIGADPAGDGKGGDDRG
jgi:hypothetical protein